MVEDGLTDLDVLKERITSLTPDRDVAKAALEIYRVGGGIFLVLWADGRLPWQFAPPAGIGDVTTGCFAVVVAVLLAKKAAGARRHHASPHCCP